MKIIEVTNLNNSNIKEFIQDNCQPFLKSINNDHEFKLLRGSKTADHGKIAKVRTDRRPLNTPLNFHNVLIDAFTEAGFKAHRGNSLFVTGDYSQAKSYGSVFCVYPIGDFDITWSPEVYDLFGSHFFVNFLDNNALKVDLDAIKISDFINVNLTIGMLMAKSQGIPHAGSYTYTRDHMEEIKEYANKVSDESLKKVMHDLNLNDEDIYKTLGYALFKDMYKMPTLINVSIDEWIKKRYRNDDMIAAINSRQEIMVRCDSALYVGYHDHIGIFELF